ncbi:MAG TPA: hypothetical protein VI197_18000, partial [Polyangiaceae bacterium]
MTISSLSRWLAFTCVAAAATAAAAPPHPEPRVIVNVLSVNGPHAPLAVQRAARLAWGRIIRCYKANDNGAKGRLELQLRVSQVGSVAGVRVGPSTLDSAELVRCIADSMQGLAMPRASTDSTADIEI